MAVSDETLAIGTDCRFRHIRPFLSPSCLLRVLSIGFGLLSCVLFLCIVIKPPAGISRNSGFSGARRSVESHCEEIEPLVVFDLFVPHHCHWNSRRDA